MNHVIPGRLKLIKHFMRVKTIKCLKTGVQFDYSNSKKPKVVEDEWIIEDTLEDFVIWSNGKFAEIID